MKTLLPISLLCGLFLLLTGLPEIDGRQRQAIAEEPPVSETIIVDLAGGRSFTAEVDPRTDASELWLRWRRGGSTILRPVQWDRVVRARFGPETVSGEQLREVVATVRHKIATAESPALARDDHTSGR